jgi:hypothetical protein
VSGIIRALATLGGRSPTAWRMGEVDKQRTSFDCGVSALPGLAGQRSGEGLGQTIRPGGFEGPSVRGFPTILQVKEGLPYAPTRRNRVFLPR